MTDTGVFFGDIEEADVWDAEPLIAPEQVAMRLHRLRVEVEQFVGQDGPQWDDLDDEQRELALAIAVVMVRWIAEREPDNPALTAQRIHEVRVYLSGGVVRDWDELPGDERQIAIDLVTLIIRWLEREGPR